MVSMAVAALLIILTTLLIGDASTIGNVFVISLFIIVIPYFVCEYTGFLWLKSVEKQFPNFIRDLADSKRSGMSLPEAVHICSKTNYGKLTSEIKSMSNRLTWGTPFLRVMEIFGKRVKNSKIILEALDIMSESYKSGGNITATLDSVAKDIRTLQDAEEERRGLVRQHVMIMYAIFFIFLAVSLSIIYVMVPMMSQQPKGEVEALAFTFVNPCPDTCWIMAEAECKNNLDRCIWKQDTISKENKCFETQSLVFPCNLFVVTCSMFNVSSSGIACYYVALFFFILVIQGIFSGLIAGQLGENSVVAGSKHSIIMVSAAISIFMFLSKLGLLPS